MTHDETLQNALQAPVLVVDDDPLQLGLIIELLGFEGVEAVGAETADEALAVLRSSEIAVVVLDLRLPDGEGSALIERVVAAAPRARVIINTGYAELETAKDAVNLGAFAYLEKGRDASELVVATLRGLRDYAESRMAAAQRKLESIAEHAPDLIAEVARDGAVITANRPIAAGERTLARLLPACVDGMDHAEHVRRCVETGEAIDFECAGASPADGVERVYACRLGRIEGSANGDGPEAVLIARDVTAARAGERRLRERDEQLRQSRKMEAVGSLAGGVAHDFNNLVLAMQAFARLASDSLPKDHPAAAHLERITEATEQAGAITQGLLTYTRKRPLQRVPVDLSEVIGRTLAMTRRVIPATIDVRTELAPAGSAVVIGDETRVQQVVMNLTVNARDAMPSGGTLAVSTHVERAGGVAVVTVSDTGVGMPPAVLERVFEPYFTTKAREQGTGMGLSIIQGIVQEMGGVITVDSTPGEGSTFTVRLPLADVAASVSGAPIGDEMDANGSTLEAVPLGGEPNGGRDGPSDEVLDRVSAWEPLGGRAVVVGETEQVRRVLHLMLGSLGYAVEQHESAEAVETPADLFVVDGETVRSGAAMGLAGGPVLAITDGDEPEGCDAVVTRPFGKQDLENAVRSIAGRPNDSAG